MLRSSDKDWRVRALLTRSTYLPQLQALARALHLRGVLREWYYCLARPPDGIVHVQAGGIAAQFHADTPYELRMVEGWSEESIFKHLIAFLRRGDTVYDIGANLGLYTVFLARAVGPEGRVVAVEPDSEAYSKLDRNVRLNGLTNVKLFRKALGEERAQLKLYKGTDITDSTLADVIRANGDRYEVVEVLGGDALRGTEELPTPRVVKIDVEGYEYAVLQGLRHTLAEKACELVCCEVHTNLLPPRIRPEQIVSFLRSLGFTAVESDASPGYPLFHLIASKAPA